MWGACSFHGLCARQALGSILPARSTPTTRESTGCLRDGCRGIPGNLEKHVIGACIAAQQKGHLVFHGLVFESSAGYSTDGYGNRLMRCS